MEKHIQTILLSICTASILFAGNSIFNLSVSMAEVKTTVNAIKESTKDYVTKQEIEAARKVRDQQMSAIGDRLTKVEAKVESLSN